MANSKGLLEGIRLDGFYNDVIEEIDKEVNKLGNEWQPLKANLFDGSLEVFEETRYKYWEFLNSLRWYR